MTLLELVVAGTLAAAVVGSLHAALVGVTAATDDLRGENDVLRHADHALRFVTRRCRRADGVAAVTGGANGDFSLAVGGGETLRFYRVGRELRADDSRIAAGSVRAVGEHLTSFTPTFYEADGATVTTDPAAAALIDIALTVDLPRDHQPGRTVRGRVWVRRW